MPMRRGGDRCGAEARLDAHREKQEGRAVAQQCDILLRSVELGKCRGGLNDAGTCRLQCILRGRLAGRGLFGSRSKLSQVLCAFVLRAGLAGREIQRRLRLAGLRRRLQGGKLRSVMRGACGSELGLSGVEVCHGYGLFSASISSAWTATITGWRKST